LGAIAAGCCCVIKPSEVAAHYANVLAELVPKYLDPSAFRVVLGAVSETTKLLELKWNHSTLSPDPATYICLYMLTTTYLHSSFVSSVFYTGNGTVARIISAAAAKHLTPVTLELGGKSPVIVDPNFNSPNTCGVENLSGLALAAKRIFWGKTSNAGQICVSPDYVLLPTKGNPKAKEEMEQGFKQAYKESFPQESPLDSVSYSKMINENHYKRVERLLGGSKGRVVCGGGKDEKKVRIEPTVLFDVGEDDTLMEGENFGPVLPVLDVGTVEDAIEFVRKRDHPLVLYVFSDDEEFKRKGELSLLVFNFFFFGVKARTLFHF
jgi:aldehyde dehydrogenase (NAD+)